MWLLHFNQSLWYRVDAQTSEAALYITSMSCIWKSCIFPFLLQIVGLDSFHYFLYNLLSSFLLVQSLSISLYLCFAIYSDISPPYPPPIDQKVSSKQSPAPLDLQSFLLCSIETPASSQETTSSLLSYPSIPGSVLPRTRFLLHLYHICFSPSFSPPSSLLLSPDRASLFEARVQAAVLAATEFGVMRSDLDTYPFGIIIPLHQCLQYSRPNPPPHLPRSGYSLLRREDICDAHKCEKLALHGTLGESKDGNVTMDSVMARMRFAGDSRLHEATRVLCSSRPVLIRISQVRVQLVPKQ